jgi:hypothetical protein
LSCQIGNVCYSRFIRNPFGTSKIRDSHNPKSLVFAGVDPFDGVQTQPFRIGKKAPLKVNPCLPAGRLSNLQLLSRGVEGLTVQ